MLYDDSDKAFITYLLCLAVFCHCAQRFKPYLLRLATLAMGQSLNWLI